MKRVYGKKCCVCLILIILQIIIVPVKAAIGEAVLTSAQVPSKIEETAYTAFDLSSLDNRQIIGSGTFEAKENEELVIQITPTIEKGTVHLFLFDPSGKEVKYTLIDQNQTIEVSLAEGRWAYNCTGFWEEAGRIELIGTIRDSKH